VKYAAIADWALEGEFTVTFMCEQLGVIRQGYYRWLASGPSQRERTDVELTPTIRAIHRDLHGDPGVRRVWAELVVRGVRVARKRVWRLMRGAGLQGRHPRAWRKTTVAGLRPIDAADLVGRDFTADAPDTRWCGDISYVQTVEGWAYTATVIDLHSRKVVGYAVADHLRTSLIIEALTAALVTRRPAEGVIFHSDRGRPIYVARVRRLLRGKRCRTVDGPTRDMFRQRRRRVVLRHLQEGTHPHPTMARRRRGSAAHIPVDRELLQPSSATLHARLLDTQRIRTRIQEPNRLGSLNR
jgi:putative transposase